MMVTLDQEEVRALVRALDGYLPELEYDLARVKHERDRHELVALDRVLLSLRNRLRHELDERPGQERVR